jgi:hypothetical protein
MYPAGLRNPWGPQPEMGWQGIDEGQFTMALVDEAIFLNASTALGNNSGPVTPPVGPPPRRWGSIVANPS